MTSQECLEESWKKTGRIFTSFVATTATLWICASYSEWPNTNIEPLRTTPNNPVGKRLPDCILIGVRKGGTRALIEMLGLHSKIKIAHDEIHFFDDELRYKQGREWYKNQMPTTSSPYQIVVEKTPSYFVTDGVPERVYTMNNQTKLLLVVRDPVTRLISDYSQLAEKIRLRNNSFKSFEEFVTQDDSQTINPINDAVERSIYVTSMVKWLQVFPRDQIHIVNGEKLIKKPWQELNKVEKFLHLKPEISESYFQFIPSKGFHCLRHKTKYVKCLAKTKGRRHPSVSKELLHKLRTFFRPYNYKFYDLTGQDHGWPED